MSASARPAVATAADSLRRVGAFGLAGAGLSALNLVTGVGLPCPFRMLTGWLCPLCGGTHLGVALLTGDLGAAWQANPLLLIAAVALGVRTLGWIVELVWQPGWAGRRWVPARVSRHWAWLAGIVAVVYVLGRNLA